MTFEEFAERVAAELVLHHPDIARGKGFSWSAHGRAVFLQHLPPFASVMMDEAERDSDDPHTLAKFELIEGNIKPATAAIAQRLK